MHKHRSGMTGNRTCNLSINRLVRTHTHTRTQAHTHTCLDLPVRKVYQSYTRKADFQVFLVRQGHKDEHTNSPYLFSGFSIETFLVLQSLSHLHPPLQWPWWSMMNLSCLVARYFLETVLFIYCRQTAVGKDVGYTVYTYIPAYNNINNSGE